MSGGLGPTADDLTREAIAGAANVALELDADSLEHIAAMFRRRNREMPERNRVQAMFPVGSRPIPNPEGTAPGVEMAVANGSAGTAHVFALPGVPAEMKQMWTASVVPALRTLGAGRQVIVHHRVKCFGVGESALEQMLPDLIRRGREPSVGITVHEATITLRISSRADSVEAALAAMQPTRDVIQQCLGTLIFGEQDDELQHAVGRLLRQRQWTIATSESDTTGLVAQWLHGLPEIADLVRGSVVRRGDTRPPLAIADELRQQFQADVGLVVGSVPAVEGGEVVHAVVTPGHRRERVTNWGGHSAIVRPLAAKQALNLLRLTLLGEKP
jgi:nicotinamide-nucleotide amidase